MTHEIYVSYATQDKQVADAVVAGIEATGFQCWVAPRDIKPGDDWAGAIVEAITSAEAVVLVMSQHTNESKQVIRELETAVSNGIMVIPLRISEVEPTGALAYFVGGAHWIDALSPPLEAHIARLTEALGALVNRDHSADAESLPAVIPDPEKDTGVIEVDVVENDALDFAADVLALKHADGAFYGVDKAVASRYLDRLGLPFPTPEAVWEGLVVESRRSIASGRIAVIRVPSLFEFGHREIRRFASAILRVLSDQAVAVRHLALTIQGAALLLDEAEVLETQLGGLIDALDDGHLPADLRRITFVERDPERAAKMLTAVRRVLPDGVIPVRHLTSSTPEADLERAPTGAAPFEPYLGTEPYLFVSYAHADSEEVFEHLGALHNEGYRIWYDAGIPPGTNWEDSIAEAIAGAEQVLVCLTPRSASSPHVRDEISYALNKDKAFLAAYLEETDLPPGLELRIGNKQALMLHRHPGGLYANVIAQALVPTVR